MDRMRVTTCNWRNRKPNMIIRMTRPGKEKCAKILPENKNGTGKKSRTARSATLTWGGEE